MAQKLKIDNKLLPLAKRYSDAIVAVAKDRGELDEVFADLGTISESFDIVTKMKDFLMHPVIPFAEKKDMIKSVFQGRVKDSTLSLLFILTEKNRLNLLDTIKKIPFLFIRREPASALIAHRKILLQLEFFLLQLHEQAKTSIFFIPHFLKSTLNPIICGFMRFTQGIWESDRPTRLLNGDT